MTFLLTLLNHKYLLGTLVIVSILTGMYWYAEIQTKQINSLKNEISTLKNELIIKEARVNDLDLATKQIEQTLSLNIALRHELDTFKAELNKSIDTRLDIFEKHNLEKLASAKPKLIENRVNKATEQVFTQIEKETIQFNEDMR